MPQLKLRACLESLGFVLGQQTFADAVEAVWQEAARLGACYLDSDRIIDLRDWITSQVLAQVDTYEGIKRRLAEARQRDPAGYYRRLVAQAPGAHGAALAISPAYRQAARNGG